MTEQCDGVDAKDDDPHLTDEKWLRESDMREKNTILQNKNFLQEMLLKTQLRVPLDAEPVGMQM